MDPNQAAAEAAAAAVDPNSSVQKGIMATITGKSPADKMLNDRTHGSARVVEGMDMEGDFARKLDQALAAKEGSQPPPESQPAAPSAPAQPAAPKDPLAPPKIGKHGHIRQLKEGIAAKEQSWEAEKTQLMARIAEFEKSNTEAPPPQFNDILKENENLKRELTLLDITKSPQFASKFDQPRKVTITQAKNIAGDKGAEVETILSMPAGLLRDQKLDELISELPASTAAIVKAANSKLAEIDFSRQVEIETAKAGLEDHLKQQERLGLLQKQQQEQEFNELLRSWQTDVEALNPSKNKAANNLIENARKMFDGVPQAKERAAASLQAALFPALLEEHNAALSEVERLRTALQRYESGLPSGESTAVETPNIPSVPNTLEGRMADFEKVLDEKMRRDPTWSSVRRGRLY